MRDHTQISRRIWTGRAGRELRELGHFTHLLALYLITNPHTDPLGVYYLPIPLAAHEMGTGDLDPAQAAIRVREALDQLTRIGYCTYDEETEYVWVHEAAFCHFGRLSEADNRTRQCQRLFDAIPSPRLSQAFYDKYRKILCLEPSPGMADSAEDDEASMLGPATTEGGCPSAEAKPSTPDPAITTEEPVEESVEQDKKTEKAAPAKKSNTYPEAFERLWQNRPRRDGADGKRSAYHAWNARIRAGASEQELAEGLERYARYIRARGKEHTPYVMQLSRFFGPDEHFRQPWNAPGHSGTVPANPGEGYYGGRAADEEAARILDRMTRGKGKPQEGQDKQKGREE